jgi:hypothetical protein
MFWDVTLFTSVEVNYTLRMAAEISFEAFVCFNYNAIGYSLDNIKKLKLYVDLDQEFCNIMNTYIEASNELNLP